MQKVIAHIEAINAATGSTWVLNADHWAGYEITTPEAFDRYVLTTSIWDAYKYGLGFKPHGMMMEAMSMEQLERELESVRASIDANAEHEAERERVNNFTWQEHLACANMPAMANDSPFAVLQGVR